RNHHNSSYAISKTLIKPDDSTSNKLCQFYFPNPSLFLNFSLDSPIFIYYNSKSVGLKALKNIWGHFCDTASELP
ncbi:MAG: hypothetical protein QME81_01255, partial [bacterium]|nr:hypothetical protein [bacterium]